MPLTEMQKRVMQVVGVSRNSESHVAGGVLVNRDDQSPRYSVDINFFHDRSEIVCKYADADTSRLTAAGFKIEWVVRQPTMCRADVHRGDELLRLDWCNDSPFRFFPVQADALFGYCLHPADVATNKALAAAGRTEIRDFIDLLYLHDTYLHLGLILWAASGKDQGFTPLLLLNYAMKNMRFRDQDLANEKLRHPIDLRGLKSRWLAAAEAAEALIARLPPREIGCLYLNASGQPISPDPTKPEFAYLIRHYGSVGGSSPTINTQSALESR